jgi:hypothetical protein
MRAVAGEALMGHRLLVLLPEGGCTREVRVALPTLRGFLIIPLEMFGMRASFSHSNTAHHDALSASHSIRGLKRRLRNVCLLGALLAPLAACAPSDDDGSSTRDNATGGSVFTTSIKNTVYDAEDISIRFFAGIQDTGTASQWAYLVQKDHPTCVSIVDAKLIGKTATIGRESTDCSNVWLDASLQKDNTLLVQGTFNGAQTAPVLLFPRTKNALQGRYKVSNSDDIEVANAVLTELTIDGNDDDGISFSVTLADEAETLRAKAFYPQLSSYVGQTENTVEYASVEARDDVGSGFLLVPHVSKGNYIIRLTHWRFPNESRSVEFTRVQ